MTMNGSMALRADGCSVLPGTLADFRVLLSPDFPA
jgi:hypothetical protein